MSLPPPFVPPAQPPGAAEQYLVSHGKSGALGVFATTQPLGLRRGTRVVVRSARGTELGTVLSPATLNQARLFAAAWSGQLVRTVGSDDDRQLAELHRLGQTIFDDARARLVAAGCDADVLDVDVLLDGRQAVLQYVGADAGLDDLAHALEQQFRLEIRLENVAQPKDDEPHAGHGGCGKPDCGQTDGGGGCSSCGTGGGCSSCGTGGVDLRQYFSHLRDQMESRRRPLL
jgi:hypothetical protein